MMVTHFRNDEKYNYHALLSEITNTVNIDANGTFITAFTQFRDEVLNINQKNNGLHLTLGLAPQ